MHDWRHTSRSPPIGGEGPWRCTTGDTRQVPPARGGVPGKSLLWDPARHMDTTHFCPKLALSGWLSRWLSRWSPGGCGMAFGWPSLERSDISGIPLDTQQSAIRTRWCSAPPRAVRSASPYMMLCSTAEGGVEPTLLQVRDDAPGARRGTRQARTSPCTRQHDGAAVRVGDAEHHDPQACGEGSRRGAPSTSAPRCDRHRGGMRTSDSSRGRRWPRPERSVSSSRTTAARSSIPIARPLVGIKGAARRTDEVRMRSADHGTPAGKPPGSTTAKLLDAFVDRVAERVVELIRAEPGLGTPRYATAKENPTGSQKAFRRGCRARGFESFMRGRTRVAEWADVERWWREEQRRVRPGDDLQSQLEAASAPMRRGAGKGAA